MDGVAGHIGLKYFVKSSNPFISTLFQIAYEGNFQSLLTVTFWQKVVFLISNAR